MGNAEASKERIREATLAEFAAYGVAGARSIGLPTAGCNKNLIYIYFQCEPAMAVPHTAGLKSRRRCPSAARPRRCTSPLPTSLRSSCRSRRRDPPSSSRPRNWARRRGTPAWSVARRTAT